MVSRPGSCRAVMLCAGATAGVGRPSTKARSCGSKRSMFFSIVATALTLTAAMIFLATSSSAASC